MKMVGNTLIAALMVSAVAIVCSNPFGQPEQSNVPQCAQPKASGMCLAYFPAYYYNPGTEACESFIYGGCQGNQNRFSTEQECLSKCGGFKLEHKDFTLRPEFDEEDLVEKSKEESTEDDPCSLEQQMGPCRASMDRFYFNGDKCERFIYGGCEGNKNNFKTVEECRQKCGSGSSVESDSSESKSEEKSEEKTAE